MNKDIEEALEDIFIEYEKDELCDYTYINSKIEWIEYLLRAEKGMTAKEYYKHLCRRNQGLRYPKHVYNKTLSI